uniref:hypothetical protein n=1 Tax=Methylobacterium sp. B34 TaxID=95563 RepID=UPI000FE149FC|nr:hypothetical protein [Methylobacterium sp. B34]
MPWLSIVPNADTDFLVESAGRSHDGDMLFLQGSVRLQQVEPNLLLHGLQSLGCCGQAGSTKGAETAGNKKLNL